MESYFLKMKGTIPMLVRLEGGMLPRVGDTIYYDESESGSPPVEKTVTKVVRKLGEEFGDIAECAYEVHAE